MEILILTVIIVMVRLLIIEGPIMRTTEVVIQIIKIILITIMT